MVRRGFSWERRSCGLHGHATYAPDEPDLAGRLRVATPWGDAWRCLRCGDYVLGAPQGAGPAASAPLVLRGRALRDAFIIRLLAVDKVARGLFIGLLAFGIWRFNGHQDAVLQTIDTYLPLLQPFFARLGVNVQDLSAVHLLEQVLAISTSTVAMIALGAAGYAALCLLEAVGLWLMKRWGEYVAAVGTSAFLPFEIHEVALEVTFLRVLALAVNVFLVVYLVWTKRLFGVRGGNAAYEAERANQSLLEVEAAAASAETPAPASGRRSPRGLPKA